MRRKRNSFVPTNSRRNYGYVMILILNSWIRLWMSTASKHLAGYLDVCDRHEARKAHGVRCMATHPCQWTQHSVVLLFQPNRISSSNSNAYRDSNSTRIISKRKKTISSPCWSLSPQFTFSRYCLVFLILLPHGRYTHFVLCLFLRSLEIVVVFVYWQ